MQVCSFFSKGLHSCYIASNQQDECIKECMMNGGYQLVFFTPEMLLGKQKMEKNVALRQVCTPSMSSCN